MSNEECEQFERVDNEEWKAVADNLFSGVLCSFEETQKLTVFREMPPDDRMDAVIAGVLTGLFCILFSKMKEPQNRDCRDRIEQVIKTVIPMASHNAHGRVDKLRVALQGGDDQ